MDLEDTMASLRLTDRGFEHGHTSEVLVEEVEEEEEEEIAPEGMQLRRSMRLRARIRPLSPEKRRVLTKPTKITDSNFINVENYYLDKRVKRLHPTLETIYEESQQFRNHEGLMSSKKFQRRINFSAAAANCKNSVKVKKRKMKAKHLSASKRVNNKKISLKFLMDKLANIKDD